MDKPTTCSDRLSMLLFAPEIAAARLLLALLAVLLGSVIVERFVSGRLPALLHVDLRDHAIPRGLREAASAFSRSLLDMAARTVPALALGVVCSMLLLQFVSQELLSSSNFHVVAVVATASIAVPLALPTFLEIPLALGLLAAGAPVGAAVALLFAGPAINLPSLLALARSTNWKIAAVLAAFIWAVAVVGGLLMTGT